MRQDISYFQLITRGDDVGALVRRCERLAMAGLGRGRYIKEVSGFGKRFRQDMSHLQLTEDMTLYKRLWIEEGA